LNYPGFAGNTDGSVVPSWISTVPGIRHQAALGQRVHGADEIGLLVRALKQRWNGRYAVLTSPARLD
jgi:hypothetical protein